MHLGVKFMQQTDIYVRCKNADFVTQTLGVEVSQHDKVVNLQNGISVRFVNQSCMDGFIDSEYLIQLAISIPVGIASSVVANIIFDRFKPNLSQGDSIKVGNSTIEVSDVKSLQESLERAIQKQQAPTVDTKEKDGS